MPQAPARGTSLYLYGGSWTSGERSLYRFMGAALASRGYAVVVPDYRLYPAVKFPVFVEDAALALRWTERNVEGLGGTLSRVFVMGHSAGAHTSMLLVLDPSYLASAGVAPDRIAATIGIAGPYTFNPLDFVTTRPVFRTAAGDIDRARPIKLVDGPTVPLLLLHGEDDKTVGAHNSRNFAKALAAAGSKVTLKVYPRLGHLGILSAYAWPLRWRAPVLEDTLRFLEAQ
jgi:acetyl esterase/lipase